MKYGTRQSQAARKAARGERTEAKLPATGAQGKGLPPAPTENRRPAGRNSTQLADDLFAMVQAEDDLAERLKQHGCDIYAGGPYETYADRLGACIVRNGMQAVIVGRGPDGRPENYGQAYQRVCGQELPVPMRAKPNTETVVRRSAYQHAKVVGQGANGSRSASDRVREGFVDTS